jgi:hypothetical protein
MSHVDLYCEILQSRPRGHNNEDDRVGDIVPIKHVSVGVGHFISHPGVHTPASVPSVSAVRQRSSGDKEAPVATLPIPAQLNCEANALATAALIAIDPLIQQSLVFPSAVS